MNTRSLFGVALLVSLAPAVIAQTWQRPTPEQGCPVEPMLRARLMAQARASGQSIAAGSELDKKINGIGAAKTLSVSSAPVYCTKGGCPIVSVNVEAPVDGLACVARIDDYGDLRVPVDVKAVVIQWSLDPRGTCAAAKASCMFDPSGGIFAINNGSMQWSVWGYTDTMVQFYDRNESAYRKAQLDYEPHVFWRDAGGRYQSCCPVDPRIIND